MPSQCLVTARDFRLHFLAADDRSVPAVVRNGVERRGGAERRLRAHDRRWDHVRGRRMRLSDRRKAVR